LILMKKGQRGKGEEGGFSQTERSLQVVGEGKGEEIAEMGYVSKKKRCNLE